jgi:hypothetical protein
MDLSDKPRFEGAPLTYSFFHLKGMKDDRGTGNWAVVDGEQEHLRATWVSNVLSPDPAHLAPLEAMRRHNPAYFRGANVVRELHSAFPDLSIRAAAGKRYPSIGLRERVAEIWYRIAYP